jgi:hypothetical protein
MGLTLFLIAYRVATLGPQPRLHALTCALHVLTETGTHTAPLGTLFGLDHAFKDH